MAFLPLLLGLLAANDRFHSLRHTDSPAEHGDCSIYAVAKVQLGAPDILPSFAGAVR